MKSISVPINPQQRNAQWIAEAVAFLLAFCLHAGFWHFYKHIPKPLPPEEPTVIEVALIAQTTPATITQPQAPATPPSPATVAQPKPQPIMKPPMPKPVPKEMEKPKPNKVVEKPGKSAMPNPKPRPARTERPIYTPTLEEEPESPAPEPARETHHEPASAASPTRHVTEQGGGYGIQKSHAEKGEDNSYHPGGMSGFKRRYPRIAQERGWEGTVTMKVHISSDGDIGEVIVTGSSGHDMLDEAAVDMIKDAHATPARRGDKPVDSWVVVPYRFTIPK